MSVDLVGARSGVEQLRRHVARRARHIGELIGIARLRREPARAEIHQHDAAAGFPHDVLRLDVAVQQTRGVHGAERRGHVRADARRLRARSAGPAP